MFDLSPEKLVVIFIIAMIFLGPDRLPKAARTIGKVLHQARSATSDMQQEMHAALAEPRRVLDETMGEMGLPRSVPHVPSVREALTAITAPPAAVAVAAPAASTPDAAPTVAPPIVAPATAALATDGRPTDARPTDGRPTDAPVAAHRPAPVLRPPDDPNLN